MSENNDYVTLQEATALVREILTSRTIELVKFHLQPFSDERLGYLGDHKQLTIVARENHEEKILTFFVKTHVLGCNDFDKMIFKEESRFFKEVLPDLLRNYRGDLWAPKCHLVNEKAFVLEDLRAQGYKTVSETLTIEQLRAGIVSIARFHACSYLLQAKLKKPLNVAFPGYAKEKVFIKDGLAWKWLETGIEVVENVARNLKLNEKYVWQAYNLMVEVIKPEVNHAIRNVLCHEDLWSNNMMFQNECGETKCRLIDFQMTVYTCFAVDLVMFLHLNTIKDTRLKVERELIELYHTVLKETLIDCSYDDTQIISLEEVLKCVEEKRIFGLVASAQFFPIALLNKEMAKDFTKDTDTFYYHSYTSRKDFVSKAMLLDENYRTRIEESVIELIQFMENMKS